MTTTQTQSETTPTSLTVKRVVNAPREKVYQAFADPAKLAKWYAPGPMTADVHKFELKRGGAFELTMKGPGMSGDHEEHVMVAAFEEVVPNEKLVHSWSWKSDDPAMRAEGSKVTVTFKDANGGTEVTLVHSGLPSAESVQSHTHGWTAIFDKLAEQF